ncbi:Yju2p cwf16-like Zn finger [Cryptosporidium sp. chipmunk genotype I]|uniref:Yju2p cwf16-like Zn finger n=1 Tax=Cryptosporidium sp. chipmunk genotype I TaxID=1280935 RepID=UPI00351A72CC|nr:Yju2p cwf16-like Zn finger [Cryptosporidium sp. chipmunk genotype I]
MSERKVLNRYFPPDFDPKKLEESKKLLKKSKPNRKGGGYRKKKLLNIRMLYPFTIRCNGCEVYHYVGTKFNSKVEKVQNESYLGIPIWRFYGRCTQCGNVIVFKTDPKSGEYILESGAKQNFNMINKGVINKKDNDDFESKVISSVLESRSIEELEILKKLNKRLMNREVTELNALKHVLDDTEDIPDSQFITLANNTCDEIILDRERYLITNSVRNCIDSYEESTKLQHKLKDCVENSNGPERPDIAIKVKENNSTDLFFNYYDSESE